MTEPQPPADLLTLPLAHQIEAVTRLGEHLSSEELAVRSTQLIALIQDTVAQVRRDCAEARAEQVDGFDRTFQALDDCATVLLSAAMKLAAAQGLLK